MDTKVIKTLAGVVITLLAVALMFTAWWALSDRFNKQIDDVTNTLDAAELKSYTDKDGAEITGSTVLNFITEKEIKQDGIAIRVITKAGATVDYVYTAGHVRVSDATEGTNKKNAKNKSNAAYINPNGKFLGLITKDANGVIEVLTLTQQ